MMVRPRPAVSVRIQEAPRIPVDARPRTAVPSASQSHLHLIHQPGGGVLRVTRGVWRRSSEWSVATSSPGGGAPFWSTWRPSSRRRWCCLPFRGSRSTDKVARSLTSQPATACCRRPRLPARLKAGCSRGPSRACGIRTCFALPPWSCNPNRWNAWTARASWRQPSSSGILSQRRCSSSTPQVRAIRSSRTRCPFCGHPFQVTRVAQSSPRTSTGRSASSWRRISTARPLRCTSDARRCPDRSGSRPWPSRGSPDAMRSLATPPPRAASGSRSSARTATSAISPISRSDSWAPSN